MDKLSKGIITARTCIGFPQVEVSLWHNSERLQKRLIERGCAVEGLNDAQAKTYEINIDGDTVHIVLINPDDEISLSQQLALIAHEAIHITNSYLVSIGEDRPAEEEFAYIVQSICYVLFSEHLKWVNGETKQ